MTLEARFWTKVDRRKSDECWPWLAYRNGKGYGNFEHQYHTLRAHRFAWQLTRGPIPPGLLVCHSCDRPECCNPKHLFLGTNKDNQRDSVAKGRHIHGVTHGNARCTEDDVLAIRQKYAAGGVLQRELAAEFGVSRVHIGRIIRNCRWAYLPP